MTRIYTQQEAAKILGYKHYRSLNRLISDGQLECMKRKGLRAGKLFTEAHLQNYLKSTVV